VPESTQSFTLEQGRIRLADAVFVYPERTTSAEQPLPPGVGPRSYGLAPTARSPTGAVLVAVAAGEAMWLGFEAIDRASPAIVRVRSDSLGGRDALTGEPWTEVLRQHPRNHLVCPPDSRLAGMREPAGFLPFTLNRADEQSQSARTLTVLCYLDIIACVRIELASPATFTRLTGGIPEPLDPESAYKGWRLP
jgi:hypothetical protein